MKYLIIFYTKDPKPPEIYHSHEISKLFDRIKELTLKRAKFTISEIGDCICDFS